jgi:DNA polymerase I-like protein with 3'-5' exonuclease and polymerase domains
VNPANRSAISLLISLRESTMISLDCEATGIDFHHGARPFCVTMGREDGCVENYTWPVDPLTREVLYDVDELAEIRHKIESQRIVFQNGKFDIKALSFIGISNGISWERIDDTLIAGHLLNSSAPHTLTDMVLQYLGIDIQPYEDQLEKCVQACRRFARSKYPDWMIAKEGLDCMPSASERTYQYDYWLPVAIATAEKYPKPKEKCKHKWDENHYCERCKGHHYWLVLKEYAEADSAVTLPLWLYMKQEIMARHLWKLYEESMKVQPVLYGIEQYGVNMNIDRLNELSTSYYEGVVEAEGVCKGIALEYGYEVIIPKGGRNKSLEEFVFQVMKLPVVVETDKGAPSLNKLAIEEWLSKYPTTSKEYKFIWNLWGKRRRETSLQFIEAYRKFAVMEEPDKDGNYVWYRLYPGYNQTATATLRMGSYNPNGTQISKKHMDEDDPFNLRYAFGPLPGRVWYSMDYENIELKIPAYRSGEEKMIELFEKPNEPPYFGSYHLLNISLLYPKLFWPLAQQKGAFKKKYNATWYTWGKNTGFAVQYGCQKRKADSTAHVEGAFELLNTGLPKVARLKAEVARFAEKNGYIETIPDKHVDPHRGYPLLCQRTEWGKILPTTPFSYFVQGSAMWCTRKALVRCHNQLNEWREKEKYDGHIVLCPHDELVFDLPVHPSNEAKVKVLKGLMEKSGEDIGIPLTVSVTHCPVYWND